MDIKMMIAEAIARHEYEFADILKDFLEGEPVGLVYHYPDYFRPENRAKGVLWA